ncbi:patatin-like phospholipase family protein [Amycolatopsis pithecellobii]|uniref:Patatin-like phospholipase family protein n=1 Tax=Amycolatopsis pithecellobii TaxID=664692 RepID=A0A6N7Z525_9PSEU|nr:patatin-like phospholipase family protein [Amycolatopsis pithecellobii]MTD57303.1 patatin-like phospholipase family protein [Amycolatopsis pithecellobii]
MTDSSRRAVVLSGGGLLGAAWQAGLLRGLTEAGVDLAGADTVIGTSAGSLSGASFTMGGDPQELLRILDQAVASVESFVTPERFGRMFEIMAQAAAEDSPEAGRRRIGQAALEAETIAEADFGPKFSFLGEKWPDGFVCTAVEATSGAFQAWASGSNVPLFRAVASSCAAPLVFPAVDIDGRRYLDGGLNSNLNSELAREFGRILAVSCLPVTTPVPDAGPMADSMAAQVAAELEERRAAGSQVELIEPGPEFLDVTDGGRNYMVRANVQPAFEAGLRQALGAAQRVSEMWTA